MDREESKKTSDRMLDVRGCEAESCVSRIAGRRAYGYERDFSAVAADEAALISEAADRVLQPIGLEHLSELERPRCPNSDRPAVDCAHADVHPPVRAALLIARARSRRSRGQVAADHFKRASRRAARCSGTEAKPGQPTSHLPSRRLAAVRQVRRPAPVPRPGGRGTLVRMSLGPRTDGCGGIRIEAVGVEHHVRDLVCGMLADPQTRRALAKLADDGDNQQAVEGLRGLEAKRQRLVDLYTDGDISRPDFRRRRDEIDERARALETDIAQRTGNRVLADVPATFEELVVVWEERGIEFKRRLAQALLEPIIVAPAGSRRRSFDPDQLVSSPAPEHADHPCENFDRLKRGCQAAASPNIAARTAG